MSDLINKRNHECTHCIKCLKKCPTDAISIAGGEVVIDDDKCIHCDYCIKNCDNRNLRIVNTHREDTLSLHEYNVALIPTSILSDMKSYEDYCITMEAIKNLGFDEVLNYSEIEGFLYKKALEVRGNTDEVMITSFCPVINRLIEKHYPTLYERILPFEYPVEIAAKRVRERLEGKDVGIYSICECVGKMALAKYPCGNMESNIDYAMTISHIFPKIDKESVKEYPRQTIHRKGVESIVGRSYGNHALSVFTVEGLNQARNILELIEFDQLNHIDLVSMYACYEGCVGGYFLWNNPFEGCYNIERMMEHYNASDISLDEDEYLVKRELSKSEMLSRKERMEWFKRVNEIYEALPQFDCGACGYANCRSLAQNIALGKENYDTCRVLKRKNDD